MLLIIYSLKLKDYLGLHKGGAQVPEVIIKEIPSLGIDSSKKKLRDFFEW